MNIKTLTLAAVAALAGLASCADQPDVYESTGGVPSVTYVRLADAAKKDSMITGAYMQTPICIVGSNLRSVRQIDFNDRTAVLNTSYMTDNTILVSVPKVMPDNVTDKMYLITVGGDTIAYNFQVLVNAPTLIAMENEQVKPGEEAVIQGNFFLDYPDYPLSIEFAGNKTLPHDAITSVTMNEIRFTMPEGVQEGPIKVKTKYGTTRSGFHLYDHRGILFDFDTPNAVTSAVLGNHGWHARDIVSDQTSLSGNYLMLGGVDMGADGGWNDGAFSFEYWAGDWNGGFSGDGVKLSDLVDFTDWENMSLKFEMCIPDDGAWGAAPMQVIFAGPDKVTISNANNQFFRTDGDFDNNGWPRAIYAPWAGTGTTYSTRGKWVTVTLPLGGNNGVFNKAYDGGAATMAFTKPDDFASLTIFCVNAGGYQGVDCHPIIKIDNIRAVPNK